MPALLLAAAVLAVAPTAQAQQFFDFNGQTLLPAQLGGSLTMYSVVVNNNQVPTPIPLDFANFEYTLVVTNLVWTGAGTTQTYAGGAIVLYEDNATVADYTNPSTFTDGTAILSGTVVTLGRTMFTANLGTASGLVDWTGGTRLDEMAPADRLSWAFVTGISNRSTVTQPGYDENWDGKVEPQSPIVPNADRSFGALKGAYQN
jgi:hypothetical protein